MAHRAANSRANAKIAGRLYAAYWGLVMTSKEREKVGKKVLDHPENKWPACCLEPCNSAALRGMKGKVLEDHLIYLISMMEGM